MLPFYRENEQVSFESMSQIEGLEYIHENIEEAEVSFNQALYSEEKPSHETLEMPICRTTRH